MAIGAIRDRIKRRKKKLSGMSLEELARLQKKHPTSAPVAMQALKNYRKKQDAALKELMGH